MRIFNSVFGVVWFFVGFWFTTHNIWYTPWFLGVTLFILLLSSFDWYRDVEGQKPHKLIFTTIWMFVWAVLAYVWVFKLHIQPVAFLFVAPFIVNVCALIESLVCSSTTFD